MPCLVNIFCYVRCQLRLRVHPRRDKSTHAPKQIHHLPVSAVSRVAGKSAGSVLIASAGKHAQQILINDGCLEECFMILRKQDDKVIIEVSMNREVKDASSRQPEQTRENNSFAKLYRIMHS